MARIATGAGTLDSIVTSEGDRLGIRSGGTLNYLVPDPHGNVAGSLSADEATIVNAIRYDAYGETIATGTAGGSAVGAGAWTYQGRLDVSPAGLASPLLDMSARFYAPAIGAFTQLDSVMGSAQNPLSMNRYLYAHANPATLIDPTGHYAMETEYGYTKSSPDPRHQQVSRRCQSRGDYGCGRTASHARVKPAPAAAKPRVRPGHPGGVNRSSESEARHRDLARDLRIAVESAPVNPFALEQDRGYQRLWSDAYGACLQDDEACRFFDALDGWERSNGAAFCSANGPYCQEVSNARGAEVWLTLGLVLETGVLAAAILTPIPGDEAVVGSAEVATIAAQQAASQNVQRLIGSGSGIAGASRWTRTSFGVNRVYQRSDLIDPALVDRTGMTNLQRMRLGRPPVGPDGRAINLHHMLQTQSGPIAEVAATMHQQYSRILHINPSRIPSGINRTEFDAWRAEYWMWRAKDF